MSGKRPKKQRNQLDIQTVKFDNPPERVATGEVGGWKAPVVQPHCPECDCCLPGFSGKVPSNIDPGDCTCNCHIAWRIANQRLLVS